MVHVWQRMVALQVCLLSKSILLWSVNGFFYAYSVLSMFEGVCFLVSFMYCTNFGYYAVLNGKNGIIVFQAYGQRVQVVAPTCIFQNIKNKHAVQPIKTCAIPYHIHTLPLLNYSGW